MPVDVIIRAREGKDPKQHQGQIVEMGPHRRKHNWGRKVCRPCFWTVTITDCEFDDVKKYHRRRFAPTAPRTPLEIAADWPPKEKYVLRSRFVINMDTISREDLQELNNNDWVEWTKEKFESMIFDREPGAALKYLLGQKVDW